MDRVDRVDEVDEVDEVDGKQGRMGLCFRDEGLLINKSINYMDFELRYMSLVDWMVFIGSREVVKMRRFIGGGDYGLCVSRKD